MLLKWSLLDSCCRSASVATVTGKAVQLLKTHSVSWWVGRQEVEGGQGVMVEEVGHVVAVHREDRVRGLDLGTRRHVVVVHQGSQEYHLDERRRARASTSQFRVACLDDSVSIAEQSRWLDDE